MVREHKIPGLFSDPGSGFGQEDNPEFELALALQHGRPGDPRLLEILIERYAGEIYRFAAVLLDSVDYPSPPNSQICALVEETFVAAVSDLDQFWGEASIRVWLFGICFQLYRSKRRGQKIGQWLGRTELAGESWKIYRRSKPGDSSQSEILTHFCDLTENQRLVLILEYIFEWEVQEIANLSKIPASRIKLQPEYRPDASSLQEDRGKEILRRCWSYQPLSQKEIERLTLAARSRLTGGHRFEDFIPPLRKASWIGLFAVIFVGAAWMITRSGYLVDEINSIPGPPTPTSYPLPAAISIPDSALSIEWKASESRAPEFVFNGEPTLSGDGSSIVFTHYEARQGEGMIEQLPEIILYDVIQDKLIRVNRPTINAEGADRQEESPPAPLDKGGAGGELDASAMDWGYDPSISDDGRWVVFMSAEKNAASDESKSCTLFRIEERTCSGIYLFDRITQRTERIDRPYYGDALDGESFGPHISPSGRFVVFWSSSNNLVSDDVFPCGQNYSEKDQCVDIFILDWVDGEVIQVPVGRPREAYSNHGLDISSDAGMIAVTLQTGDRILEESGSGFESEAYLYDLRAAQFQPLNVSSEGIRGDAESQEAVISADGRFAAFISSAGNLVPGDTNEIADVFVRDLRAGVTERVSLTSDGRQGTVQTLQPGSGWGSYLSIAADGRFIAFAYGVNDLDGRPLNTCDRFSPESCNSIYFHDRENATTRRIAGPLKGRALLSPGVSNDGRYVSFSEWFQNCSIDYVQRICGEIWLHDQDKDWTSRVSKGRFPQSDSRAWFQEPQTIPEVSAELAIAPDGQSVATVYRAKDHNPMINIWNLNGSVHKSFLLSTSGEDITSVAFSPDGEFIAAGMENGNVDIWRISDRHLAFNLDGQIGKVIEIGFTDDGNKLVVGSTKSVWIWARRDRSFVRVSAFNFPLESLLDLAIAPDGNHLALATSDGTVWLQSLTSGKIITRLQTRDGAPLSVAFSPDATKLAIGSKDGSVQIWDLDGSSQIQDFTGLEKLAQELDEAASQHSEAAQNAPRDLEVNYQLTLLHPDQVKKVAFSPDGSLLASMSLDGKLRLWNYAEGTLLDSYPKEPWEQVNTFSIAPDGASIAVSSWSGPTHLFQAPAKMGEPLLFKRAQEDILNLPLAFPTDPALRAWRAPAQNLYQAAEALNFDMKVPAYLPPGFLFGSIRFVRMNDAAWLQYPYYERPGEPLKANIYIFQGPDVAEISDLPIGASAVVETVSLGDRRAEVVKGDWVAVGTRSSGSASPEAMAPLRWQTEAPVYRLRFQAGSRIVSIYFEQIAVGEGETLYLNKADLVAIAESLVSLDEAYHPDPVLLNYTVEEGDTCSSIAARFGTSVGNIVGQNNLIEGCDFIYTGQNLLIPLNEERRTLGESDLNCDGQIERVWLIPNPLSEDGERVLGVTVDKLTNLGLYQEVWRYTIAEAQARFFTLPQLYRTGECQHELAFNLILDSSNNARFEIFRWDGESIIPVNDVEAEVIFDLPR